MQNGTTGEQWLDQEIEVRQLWNKHQDDPAYLTKLAELLVRRASNPADTNERYEKIDQVMKDYDQTLGWYYQELFQKIDKMLEGIEQELRPFMKNIQPKESFLKKLSYTLRDRLNDPKKTSQAYSKLEPIIKEILETLQQQQEGALTHANNQSG